MPPDPWPIYVELLSVGLPWIIFHCPGMCGPLVLAFRFGAREDGTVAWGRSQIQFLAYQTGRAVVLAAAGAGVGLLGKGFAGTFRAGMPVLTLAVAGGLLLLAVHEAGWLRLPASAIPAPLAALGRHAQRAVARGGVLAPFLLGLPLALLPCGITFFALSLAVRSQDAAHGAALMAAFVGLTTLPLAAMNLIPAALSSWRVAVGRWLVPAGLAVSAGLLIVRAVMQLRAGEVPACCA